MTTCNRAVEALDGDVVGRLTEADATRALDELEATDIAEAERTSTSLSGKGRPRHDVAVDRSALLDALAETDRIETAVERARAA